MQKNLYAIAALASFALMASPSIAQDFPKRQPISIVVPWAPGGNVDITARAIAPAMAEILGQSVVVENRPGAGGFIGSSRVAKSNPDGYTLLLGSSGSISIGPALVANPPYNPTKDLIAVGPIHSVPLVLSASGKSPIKNYADFAAKAKANPGALNVASAGVGSTQHLAIELIALKSGTKLNHVPYKGSGPAITDLLGGQVETMIDQMTASMPHIKSGAITPLAVTTKARSAGLPNVPTLQELGVKDIDMTTYTGVFAPAGTPPAVVNQINAALKQAMQRPEIRKQFESLGVEILNMDQAEFQNYVNKDFANSQAVGKAANIQLNN
jgi:tripartite-type tricarboxylate transporter receptor subunit TctC